MKKILSYLKKRIKRSIENGAGFTFIEMLIVMAIIFVLVAIPLINYKLGQKELALQRAASKLVQDIRRMEEMAMAVEKASGCFYQSGPNQGQPRFNDYKYAFGIHFEKNNQSYIFFADCDASNKYQNPTIDADIPLDSPDMNLVKIYRVYNPDQSQPDKFNKADIVFAPPDPTVSSKLIDPGEENAYRISIEIGLKDDPSRIKTITVNKVGLVDVE